MLTKIKYLIWGIVIFNLVFFSISFYVKYRVYQRIKNEYKYSMESIRLKIQQETENRMFYHSLQLHRDAPAKEFQQYIKKPILIFYFSISSCQPCLEEICNEIKLMFPNYNEREDIIFLSNDIEYRLRNNFLEKKIAKAVKDKTLPFEKYNSPILFIVDTNNVIHHVFVINKENPESLRNYLRIIHERYL